jgi:hypothetical protein
MERSLVRALRNVQRDLYHCVQCSTLMFCSEDGAAAPHVDWRRPRSRRVIGRRSSERSSRSRWRRTYAGDEGGQCRDRAASAWAPASLASLLLFPGVLLFGQPPTPCRFSHPSHAAMTMRAISWGSGGSHEDPLPPHSSCCRRHGTTTSCTRMSTIAAAGTAMNAPAKPPSVAPTSTATNTSSGWMSS